MREPRHRDEGQGAEQGCDQQDVWIADALDVWEEAQARGESVDLDVLCQHAPEILPLVRQRVAALQAFDSRFLSAALEQETPGSSVPARDVPLRSSLIDFKKLAEGGLGTVYTATDTQLHRRVAVKFLKSSHFRDTHAENRLRVEAEITGRLEHPGIVPLYAYGKTPEAQPFYVMRLVEGESLADAILRLHASGKLQHRDFFSPSFHALLRKFISICEAIAYAHNRGVLHRDIKPANIMLGRFGEALIVDWGLAISIKRNERARASGESTLVLMSSDAAMTMPATAPVGTLAFMSPEQTTGSSDLTPASDIFSLGATLYTLLCGQPPFRGKTARDMLKKIQFGDFPPLVEINQNVPDDLRDVCQKAMALQPLRRYVTAMEFARDIENWLAGAAVTAANRKRQFRLREIISRITRF